MKEFTCIVCPNGCSLHYDETTHTCTGNRCPRGAKYAEKRSHPSDAKPHLDRENLSPRIPGDLGENLDRNPQRDVFDEVMKKSTKRHRHPRLSSNQFHCDQKRLKYRRRYHHHHADEERKLTL
jgi:hypothetical protein